MAQRGAQIRLARAPAEMAAQVQVKRIRRPADVRRYLISPVDMVKGEMRAIRIAVPLPRGGRDAYLVLEVKGDALKKLMQSAGSERDVKSWIRENQRGMLKEYRKQKKRSFTFTLLPVRREPREIVPKKTERVPALPVTLRREVPRPAEIRGGNGLTKETAYGVYPMGGRKKKVAKKDIIPAPLFFEPEGLGKVWFTVHFTAEQLGVRSRLDTNNELVKIFRKALAHHASRLGRTVPPSDIRAAVSGEYVKKSLDNIARKVMKLAREEGRDDIIKAISTH